MHVTLPPAPGPAPDAPRRRFRPTLGIVAGVTVLGVLAGCTDGSPVAEPTTTGSPTTSPSATPATSPSPSPSPTPTPTAAPTPAPTAGPTAPPAASGPVFRPGNRIGDLPANAPEADAVAYLTAALGGAPSQASDRACDTSGLAGRLLSWDGTGVFLRVRTTDDAGAAVAPYAAAWVLTDEAVARGLGTDAGLRVGDPGSRIGEVYPGTPRQEPHPGEWFYPVSTAEGDLTVLAADDGSGAGERVYRIESGYGCGE